MSSQAKQNLFYLIFGLLFFSTTEPFGYASIDIDPSWTESLVMAVNQNFTFGTDFIFNYGPLGFLNTALLPEKISPWVLFLFHSFLLLNYLMIIKLSFLKMGDKWWQAAIVAVLILLPWGFFADVTFTLFYLMLFWLLYVQQTKSTLGLILAVVLAVLIFYIKVNLSLIAYTVLLLSVLYFFLAKIISWKAALLTLVSLILFTASFSLLLNVSIPDYLAASLKIIDAYQDGQAVNILKIKELGLLLILEFIILGVVLLYIFKNLAYFVDNLYLYIISALAWFLCFKQAHTATGHYNVFGFFLFLPVLAVLIFLFAKHFKGGARMVFTVLILQIISTQFIRLAIANYDLKEYALFYFPIKVVNEVKSSKNALNLINTVKYKSPYNYFSKFYHYDYQKNFQQEEINNIRLLPQAIINKIGDRSVDIMPWEISYIFFNQLNYNPRPIIQTYQANSEWLAHKNEEKYNGASAPDFVLANIHDYREQNPLWMDKGAYLALKRNYSLLDTINMPHEKLFLFEKNTNISTPDYQEVTKQEGQLGEEINLPETSNKLLYLNADIHYSFFGKIARLFFQPPYLRCKVIYQDNTEDYFRIPPPILKGGILASEKVISESDFLRFATEGENKKIKSLTFWSKYTWGFKSDFDYSLKKTK
ncbi:hypothetical protein [Arcticibacterium luteifluviistationis]|uniref:Glycosyltransferase RgtA/B/C/D-like domain-containing protein n=1 Tax=Arcticibacterium luteifluviistationis TaxID=1784714 RepID=A0A2Z4GEE6_9BACT|nr:hypothetical protein [Arcticibacterium luteifluviistationis]AWV99692.1 hypothetical protein DJ013_16535 [Arcticibacterium luteifluviistationis]